jgi:hypothetical protein
MDPLMGYASLALAGFKILKQVTDCSLKIKRTLMDVPKEVSENFFYLANGLQSIQKPLELCRKLHTRCLTAEIVRFFKYTFRTQRTEYLELRPVCNALEYWKDTKDFFLLKRYLMIQPKSQY